MIVEGNPRIHSIVPKVRYLYGKYILTYKLKHIFQKKSVYVVWIVRNNLGSEVKCNILYQKNEEIK